MRSERWRQVDEVFGAALERPAAERTTWLDGACGDDRDLRARVERLLAAERQARSFLEDPLSEVAVKNGAAGAEVGRRAGPYRLLRVLGHGGMGNVYLAGRDDDQYDRLVAVKLIRRGFESPEMQHRFRVERQILAQLEHPNIARLYDGGTTDDGRPYLAMELVSGLPIDRDCDRRRLRVEERLELFREVCSAVRYAHGNLVVHRDLKPGNILITGEGSPKLLDFGIAKLLDPESFPGHVELTRTGLHPMSPRYASPEQVRGEAITTASDVYSLGVLLYELLSGRCPYRTATGGSHEISAAILEQEPPRLGLAAGGAGDEPDNVCRARRTRPTELRRRLSGDLENIVAKAMHKDPRKRYASVEQLDDDLGRHLRGMPVRARPDTLRYRAGKFLRRHRVAAAVAALVLALVVGFLLTLAAQAERVRRERDKAQRSLDFVVELFEVSHPGQAIGGTVSARQLLDLGARRIALELEGSPEVQATIHDTVGTIYEHLGLYEQARTHVEQALAIRRDRLGERADVAGSLHNLANVLVGLGDFERAETLYREALTRRRRQHGERHPAVADTLFRLARVRARQEFHREAEAHLRQALAIRQAVFTAPHRRIAEVLGALAAALHRNGELEEAERHATAAVAMQRQVLGERHPELADTLNHLATLYVDTGRFEEGEALHEEALGLYREFLGPGHPGVAESVNNLGGLQMKRGNYRRAEELFRESHDTSLRVNPGDHPDTAIQLSNLGIVIGHQGRVAEASEFFGKALEMARRLFGDAHPRLAQIHYSWATMLHLNGELAAAGEHYRWSLDWIAAHQELAHPAFAYPKAGYGRLLLDLGRPEDGESLIREALASLRATHSPGHVRTAQAEIDLGACLMAQGRYDEAEPLLVRGHEALAAWPEDDQRRIHRARERLIELYRARGEAERAATIEALIVSPPAPAAAPS